MSNENQPADAGKQVQAMKQSDPQHQHTKWTAATGNNVGDALGKLKLPSTYGTGGSK